ncbi:MAG: hypothetical protein U0575_11550 [Phycisphaerales bacterium]
MRVPSRSSLRVVAAGLLAALGALVVVACQSPLQPDTTSQLRASVEAAIQQQIQEMPGGMHPVSAGRLDEGARPAGRDQLGPPLRAGPARSTSASSLGQPQRGAGEP